MACGLRRALYATKPSREWTTGRHLKRVDATLPEKHVKLLYDTLSRVEAWTGRAMEAERNSGQDGHQVCVEDGQIEHRAPVSQYSLEIPWAWSLTG
jgi:hypothetical protein